MMTREYLAISFAALLAGCGGGSSGGDSEPDTPNTGTLIDSPVVNIGYRTETLTGVTNDLGEYQYLPGESVTFFIGDLEFPTVRAAGIVTPLDLAGTTSLTDPKVINMIRLLQTLDKNGDPNDGIFITEAAKGAATQVDFGLSESEFESSEAVQYLVMGAMLDTERVELVLTETARAHFQEELVKAGILPPAVAGVWRLTGRPDVAIGDADLSLMVFLPSGDYYFAESNEINEGDGFEYGTYEFADGILSIVTVVDTNPATGFSSVSVASNLEIGLSDNSFSWETDDPRETGRYTFTRQPLVSSDLAGAWQAGPSGDNALLVFLETGHYVGYQPTEENGFVGFEWGSYTFENNMLTISTFDNSDGEALLCSNPAGSECMGEVYGLVVTEDRLSLSVPGEGEFVFSRGL